jgi:hypothetical protein
VGEPVAQPANLLKSALNSKESKMKKVIFICLIAIVVLMFGSVAMAGKPGNCLPTGPTTFACPTDGAGVNFTWDVLTGATKYSIDVVVVSEDLSTTVDQSFSTDTNSLSVPFTDFLICGSATAKVKGLNPPQKGTCSQNNAFSAECTFVIPCP